MALWEKRDLRAFEELTRPYLDALYRAALHLTGNRDDAEDLVQETYLRAFQSFRRLEKEGAIKAWLFKILAHALQDRLRKKPAEVSLEAEEGGLAWAAVQRGRAEESPEEEVSQAEARALVREAIAKLPPDFRAVVLLADLEGFSYKEIAQILNIPIGTVMSRLYRGRRVLRRKLQRYAEALGFAPRCYAAEEHVVELEEYRKWQREQEL